MVGVVECSGKYLAFGAQERLSASMPYEKDMQIVFDLVSRTTIVSFRGKIKTLGPFLDRREAIHAGEQFCREQGWNDAERPVK